MPSLQAQVVPSIWHVLPSPIPALPKFLPTPTMSAPPSESWGLSPSWLTVLSLLSPCLMSSIILNSHDPRKLGDEERHS